MAKRQLPVAGVAVEWDDAKHSQLNATDGPLDKKKIPQSAYKDDEFTPTRIIVDLKLDLGAAVPAVNRQLDDRGKAVPTVNLNDVHLKISYQGARPTLGWWNGVKWKIFKQVTYDDKAGIADVILPSIWPTDPAIGGNP
jgi:hypothetical protein